MTVRIGPFTASNLLAKEEVNLKDMLNRGRFLDWLTQIYATADNEIACEQAQLLLAAYVEAELAGTGPMDTLGRVRDHLLHCPDCQDEYAALLRVAELEARGALPSADEILMQLQSSAAARAVTHAVPGP